MHYRLLLFIAIAEMLAACQTNSADRGQELARICADPQNRAPGSFYFSECQAIHPLTAKQLQKDYVYRE